MGRQGKMHGSPFHVETVTYKYAIEHENDDHSSKKELIKCPHKDVGPRCLLWNSGHERCASYNCAFYRKHLRQSKGRCNQCAFCYKSLCFHPQKPSKKKVEQVAAEYCAYFVPRTEDGKAKFILIHGPIVEKRLSEQIVPKQNRMNRLSREIVALKKKRKNFEPESTQYKEIEKQRDEKKALFLQIKGEVEVLHAELDKIKAELLKAED